MTTRPIPHATISLRSHGIVLPADLTTGLDDSMWRGRAHSRGAARQLVNLIGYAVVVNGLAVQLNRKRIVTEIEANLRIDAVVS